MKAKLRLAAAAIATTLVLAACGSSGDSDTATPTSQTGAETTGPIVIGSTNEPTSCNATSVGPPGSPKPLPATCMKGSPP